MNPRLVLVIVLVGAFAAVAAPAATDKSSLSAFVHSCAMDTRGCHNYTHDIVAAAKNQNYGCIPKETSADDAGNQLLTWMKETANGDPKYAPMALEDVSWAGVDTLWPCKAP